MPERLANFRFPEAVHEQIGELADRLGTSKTEVMILALHALRLRAGLVDQDAADFHDRISRKYGDDAELTFTVNGIDRLNVDVTIDGEPVPGMLGNVLFAMTAYEGQGFQRPDSATVIAKDEHTGLWFTIGRVKLAEGEARTVSLRDMRELVQAQEDDGRTVAERRADMKMNARLREAIGRDETIHGPESS